MTTFNEDIAVVRQALLDYAPNETTTGLQVGTEATLALGRIEDLIASLRRQLAEAESE